MYAFFIFFLKNNSGIFFQKSNLNKINSKYFNLLYHLFFSQNFFFHKNLAFLQKNFFSKDLSIKLRGFYVKRYIKKFKKIRLKKWPKSVKRFLFKKLKKKYRYVFLKLKKQNKTSNLSRYFFTLISLFKSYRFFKKKVEIKLFKSNLLFLKNIDIMSNVCLFSLFFICFTHSTYSYTFLKKHEYNYFYLNFFKKLNTTLKSINFIKKYDGAVIQDFTCITNLNLFGDLNQFFFLRSANVFKKYFYKKKTIFFRRKKRAKKLDLFKFFKKFIISEIVRLDFNKFSPVYLNLSNSFLYFFFFKHFIANRNFNIILANNKKVELFNNLLPLNYLYKPLRRLVFTKFQKSYTPDFFKHMYFYLMNFLELFTKSSVFFRIKSKLRIPTTTNDDLYKIFLKHKNFQSRVGRGFFFFEMLEIMWLSFFFKDLNFLIDWFIKTMERIPFKRHKKLLSVFKFIIVNYSDVLLFNNNVKGYFFDIRGKVGVSGNAKKRHFSFYSGKYSKTTKNSKFDYQHNIVKTFTGALGVTMVMYY